MRNFFSNMSDNDGLIKCERFLPYNPDLKERSRKMRKFPTKAEYKLWKEFLQKSDYLFNRQKIINHFIVDFYCAKLKLIIEVDGQYHDTEDAKEYDKEREEILTAYNLKILRFTNNEIFENFDQVCKKIKAFF